MIFWHCTSYVPVIPAKTMGGLGFLSSMISYSDGVELGPPPRRRRMPQIFIPAQLLKETADYQGLLLGTMLL